MAAPQPVNVPARGLIVKTQDVEKMAELGRGQFGVVLAGALKIAAKVSPSAHALLRACCVSLET